jgi:hypothetical protein
MASPLRIEYEGAVYHVAVRGNERQAVFRDDADREHFVRVLGQSVGSFDVRLYLYCLKGLRNLYFKGWPRPSPVLQQHAQAAPARAL